MSKQIIELGKFESETFKTLTGLEKEYKKIKSDFAKALGLEDKKFKFPSGKIVLQSNFLDDDRYINITSSSKIDMRDFIKTHSGKQFKLVIFAENWCIG